ncbi:hypothetical protein KRX54_04530 [Actinomycetaceae bacterium TAE3-ERU4]|nr:hypothetical protein [Actinomycetaceae bacterium TAE3-ERU4]
MSQHKYTDGYRKKRPADSARLAALDILAQVREEGAYANIISSATLVDYGLSGRDAAFALELAYGTLRMRGLYDAILERCCNIELSQLDPLVLDVLRLGAHQIVSMRVPPHAALAQTVDVARHVSSDGPARLSNAVLRRVSERDPEDWFKLITVEKAKLEADSTRYSHPLWITQALYDSLQVSGLGESLEDLLEADNKAAKVNLAARPSLISQSELLAEVGARGRPGDLSSNCVILNSGVPSHIESIREGSAGVQDQGSQLVTELFVNTEISGPDRRWLDLCAGPGGKAALLAGYAAERGANLLANELHEHRARLVAKSLRAFPRDLYRIRIGDGAKIGEDSRIEHGFDRILLDAPCSGLGSLRRRPEARWVKSEGDLPELLDLQSRLLDSAFEVLRLGGLLGYVTCSPHLGETRDQVVAFQKRHSVELLNLAEIYPQFDSRYFRTDGTLQLWPHLGGTDAMFLAIFRKVK